MSNWKQSSHADVIDRTVPCSFIECPSLARWDVAVRRNGTAEGWTPYCTRHAKHVVRSALSPAPASPAHGQEVSE